MICRLNTVTCAGRGMPTAILSVTVKFSLMHFGAWVLACIKLFFGYCIRCFFLFFHVWCYCWAPRVSLFGSLSQAVNSDPALHWCGLNLLYSAQSNRVGNFRHFPGWIFSGLAGISASTTAKQKLPALRMLLIYLALGPVPPPSPSALMNRKLFSFVLVGQDIFTGSVTIAFLGAIHTKWCLFMVNCLQVCQEETEAWARKTAAASPSASTPEAHTCPRRADSSNPLQVGTAK